MRRTEMVTRVIDGDTFETDRRKHPVRLANVEAPEEGETGYDAAKAKLEGLIGGRKVEMQWVARDKHGMRIFKVQVGDTDVNLAMRSLTPIAS